VKAAPRPPVNPAVVAQFAVIALGLAITVLVYVFEWPSLGSLRALLFVSMIGFGYAAIHFLDKVKVRTQFPLNAEGAALFAAWQPLLRQDWRGALQAYRSVIEKHPACSEALLHASLLEIQYDDLEGAEKKLLAVRDRCQDDPEVRHGLALVRHNQGRFREAAEEYAHSALADDVRAAVGRAIALHQAGDREAAFEAARKAAARYTERRYKKIAEIEMPSWAAAQGVYFLAPDRETGLKEATRVFQWTESFWAGKSWMGDFDEIDQGKKYRDRHLLNLRVLLGKNEPQELIDQFDARDLDAQYVLSGWFTLAVRTARESDESARRKAWRAYLDAARDWSSPPIVPSLRSFEGLLAKAEAERKA